MPHVAVVSLGCAKNLINSEQMMYRLREAGYTLTGDMDQADVYVVNTCGFIESARQEAVDQILELAALPGKIVVTGCLAELVKDEIFTEMPEVSSIVGCGSFDKIVEAVQAARAGERYSAFDALGGAVSETPRVVTGYSGECHADGSISTASTYIKISEGCSNHCSYCTIPSLRGPHVSRPMEAVVDEARRLADLGIKEVILVAQDTTRYGIDLYGQPALCELLRKLCEVEGLRWIRLHYLYPDGCTDELIDMIASLDKIVKYVDIPIQHCSDEVLAAMNRRYTKEQLTELIHTLRRKIPDIVLRSTIITGFPGETEDHHREMCAFLYEHRIPRLGIFAYSQEPGTPAADLPDQVPEEVRQRRKEQLESLQHDVLNAYDKAMIGRLLDVLCEGYDSEAGTYYGRSYAESPEVDGRIGFTSRTPVEIGDIVRVKLTVYNEQGELFGKIRE